MEIPKSDKRERFDKILDKGYKAIYLRYSEKEILEIYDSMISMEEFELVERSNFMYYERCDWFVFRDEDWFKNMNKFDRGSYVMNNTIKVLKNHGYEEVKTPEDNDILAYFFGEDGVNAHHFGICSNEKVISKFGFGHVLKHKIDDVPNMFGTFVRFLREQKYESS